MENQNNNPEKEQVKPDGLDQWNDRLDDNLENEKEGNVVADENAREFSEKQGSGDQSDEGEE
jgi:hypothetical protein